MFEDCENCIENLNCAAPDIRYLLNKNNGGVYRCCFNCLKTQSVKKKDHIHLVSGKFEELQEARERYWSERDSENQKKWLKKIAEDKEFFSGPLWQILRFGAFSRHGNKCLCCGRQPPDVVLHVDHVKPRSKYPELAHDINNLQILCEDCNLGKSNDYETDFRKGGLR